MLTIDLNDRKLWSWRQVPVPSTFASSAGEGVEVNSSTTAPRPCAQFPSQIHAELLAAELISDPFKGRNEEVRPSQIPAPLHFPSSFH
jgi:hypothetical protein